VAPDATGVPTDAPVVATTVPARVYRIVPERSRARYRVRETFLEDQTLAVAEGSTDAVAGEVLVDRAIPERSRFGQIVVDISQLESDEERRDNAIRRQWLESARYPRATFQNARLTGLPERVVDGREFSFRMTGDMTIRDTTRRQEWDVTATLDGDTLRGEATTDIEMTRYGVEPPNIAGFVAVENDVELTLEFVATARE
jgi:polyisoprenoid-binding protein YceI